MTDENETKDDDFSAELYILEDMGIKPDKLKHVQNRAAAQKIIDYMKSKASKETKEEPEKKINKGMLNVGTDNDVELPDPEMLTDNIRKNMGDLMRPARPVHFMNNRWLNSARIMRVYTDDYPEGRVI